jgi:uncharacterized protein (DUF433 family)
MIARFDYFNSNASSMLEVINMPVNWKEYIVSAAEVLHGKPHFKGTRIPVSLVLGYLAAGYSSQKIIEEFPDLNELQIAASLDFARELSEFEVAA